MSKKCITNLRHKDFYPIKGAGYEGFLRGYFYYENQYVTHENFASIINEEILASKDFAKWNGEYALIFTNDECTTLVTDMKRSIPLFYSMDDSGNWLVQDFIQPHEGMKMNSEAEEEFLITGFVFRDKTLFEEWKQVPAVSYLLLKEEAVQHYYYSYVLPKETEPIDVFAKELKQVFNDLFDDLADRLKDRQIVIPLSGGYDSRLIALNLVERGLKDNITAFTYGRPGNGESTVSKQIADKLGLKWKYFAYDKKMWEDMYKSEEWKDYVVYSSNGVSVAHLQDFPSTKLLVEQEGLQDAVFLPGHSLDYLAGGHLPYESIVDKQFEKSEIQTFIMNKHFRLWELSGKDSYAETAIGKGLYQDIEAHSNYTNERVTSLIDEWNWRERQAKFIINSVRVYEYFGQGWSIPLWDDRLIHFFSKIPANLKYKKYLYDYTLHQMYPEYYPLPQKPGPENSLKNKYGILYPMLRKIYRKKNLYRKYFDEPMEWYGIYPTYKQYVQSLTFKRNGQKYEHPYNINSFIVKDMIQMMKEITK